MWFKVSGDVTGTNFRTAQALFRGPHATRNVVTCLQNKYQIENLLISGSTNICVIVTSDIHVTSCYGINRNFQIEASIYSITTRDMDI